MFGKVAMDTVAKSRMTKFKWTIFKNNLRGGSGIIKKGQCILLLPLKAFIF